MQEISYTTAKFPVREDLAASHNRYWERLAKPGNWLTADLRVAVAHEVRQAGDCGLCARRKEALSPNHVDGNHDVATELSAPIVELVHRVTTDPGRLTKAWFDGVREQGVSEEEYVEILGIIVALFSIDEFCRGLDIPLNTLPEPQPGEPSRYRPASAVNDTGWVSMIPGNANTGAESDLWPIGRTGNVIKALSLVPDNVRTLNDLLSSHYLHNDTIWDMAQRPQGTLSRMQTEVVASRSSAINGCFY